MRRKRRKRKSDLKPSKVYSKLHFAAFLKIAMLLIIAHEVLGEGKGPPAELYYCSIYSNVLKFNSIYISNLSYAFLKAMEQDLNQSKCREEIITNKLVASYLFQHLYST